MFYRRDDTAELLEIFLVSGISSLLLVRFYLHLAHYPQLGNTRFHIAHMLYGGLLMMVAIVLLLAYLGKKLQRIAAVIGGAGFGIFIDELGKFITRDNNYFYKPTIGIIYAVFMVLYLVFNFLGRQVHLTKEESELNALEELGEGLIGGLTHDRKKHILHLLNNAGKDNEVVSELKALLVKIEAVPVKRNIYNRFKRILKRHYSRFWANRKTNKLIGIIFLLTTLLFLAVVFASLGRNIDAAADFLKPNKGIYANGMLIGQLASGIIAALFAIIGLISLPSNRLRAFEWFRRSLLTNLLLVQFFLFSRIQFGAMPGFILNLGLLILVSAAQKEEASQIS